MDIPEVPEWYAAWVRTYTAAFGIGSDHVDGMLVWFRGFTAAGYTRAEMEAAVPEVIAGPTTPRWPSEHLAAVKAAVARLRAERLSRASEAPDFDRPRCPDCAGTGWVVVPYFADLRGGEWVPERTTAGGPKFRTGAVACRCPAGLRTVAAEQDRGRRPMALDLYERLYDPAWRDHLAERDHADKVIREVERVTPGPPAAARDFLAGIGRMDRGA